MLLLLELQLHHRHPHPCQPAVRTPIPSSWQGRPRARPGQASSQQPARAEAAAGAAAVATIMCGHLPAHRGGSSGRIRSHDHAQRRAHRVGVRKLAGLAFRHAKRLRLVCDQRVGSRPGVGGLGLRFAAR
jgi:hypothetical protein